MITIYRKIQLWIWAYGFAIIVAVLISIRLRKRMSHNAGIAGTGKIKIVDNPQFPEHDFLVAGREFPCHIRHGSVSFMDEAMKQVRSIAIKFGDNRYKSPLDMMMNTGPRSIFWSTWNFVQFVKNRHEHGGTQYQDYYKLFPEGLAGARTGVRFRPTSFTQLYYYAQCPVLFEGKDGIKRYVKFRVIPEDRGPESGLPSDEILSQVWDQQVEPGETRNRNYLSEEYKQRVNSQGAKYILQFQMHNPSKEDTDKIFDSNIEWNQNTHPFMDVANIEINHILPYEEGLKIAFSMHHHPRSLPLIPAKSIHDYNSINYMRARDTIAHLSRHWAYKIFGIPPKFPDDGPRNV